MARLVLRRLALLPPTLLGVGLVVFACLHAIPGDPVELMLGDGAGAAETAALRHDLGLDRPLPEQLAWFLGRLSRGDLGTSITFRRPVAAVIAERYPATLELALSALAVSLGTALPLGILAAVRRGTSLDRLIRTASLIGTCLPTLWSGPLLILAFSIGLGWFPVSGRDGVAHLVLPAVSLGIGMVGIIVRLTRASLLDALDQDYVRAARARGASPWHAWLRHALPNALPPVVTVVALQFGGLLAGAIITETIFAWPGLGRLVVQGIDARDYPLVEGCVLVIGCTYVLASTAADLLHAALDPRVRGDA